MNRARAAIGIYAAMARDWSDAIDMINECVDVDVLTDLHAMVAVPPVENTDYALNALFVPIVWRRLDALGDAAKKGRQ